MSFWSRHIAKLKHKMRCSNPIVIPDCLRILCYGDSNTWGFPPGGGPRFDKNVRWPGVLQSWLGNKAIVFEEGLNGRTTMWDDPLLPGRNGRQALLPILNRYAPLDFIVILLGTNDLKARFNKSAAYIAKGVEQLCQDSLNANIGRSESIPQMLLVAPPPIFQLPPNMRIEFEGAVEKSKLFAKHYSETASFLNIHYLDAGETIEASRVDSVHWGSSSHRIFGKIVADKITVVFNGTGP